MDNREDRVLSILEEMIKLLRELLQTKSPSDMLGASFNPAIEETYLPDPTEEDKLYPPLTSNGPTRMAESPQSDFLAKSKHRKSPALKRKYTKDKLMVTEPKTVLHGAIVAAGLTMPDVIKSSNVEPRGLYSYVFDGTPCRNSETRSRISRAIGLPVSDLFDVTGVPLLFKKSPGLLKKMSLSEFSAKFNSGTYSRTVRGGQNYVVVGYGITTELSLARAKSNLSQSYVSNTLRRDFPGITLTDIERGIIPAASSGLRERLAKLLGSSVSKLFDERGFARTCPVPTPT